MECQLLKSWTVRVHSDGPNSSLSPVVHGYIALSIKIQYSPIYKYIILIIKIVVQSKNYIVLCTFSRETRNHVGDVAHPIYP